MEGRAGMVAILDENGTFQPNSMVEGVKRLLPPYARPVFVRLVKDMDTTGKKFIRSFYGNLIHFYNRTCSDILLSDKVFSGYKYLEIT